MPDQGQMLDMQEGQTAKSALRDDWTLNIPHHTLEVVLEVTLEVFLNICAQDKDHDIFNPGSRSKGLSLPRS